LLLKQEGVDYEIIVGIGPGIKVPEHPLIKTVYTPLCDVSHSFNKMWPIAKGNVLLLTQCDMQINSPTQVRRMLDKWTGNNIVTEKFFKKGERDNGLYLQCCMVGKSDMDKAGGYCEQFFNPDMAGHEDGDLMATFLENGLDLDHTETPFDEGVFHIDHVIPDYINDPEMIRRLNNAKKLYWSRHKEGVHQLYTKQFIRHMMSKRINI